MTEANKSRGGKKAMKSVAIYLTDEEKTLLTSDLERANSHRTKTKLSMNELLRSRVFTKIQSPNQVVPQPIHVPSPLPDVEKIIKECLSSFRLNEGMLGGETAQLASLLEQMLAEQQRHSDWKIDELRKELLDLAELIRIRLPH